MSLFTASYRFLVREPWLAFNRVLTSQLLEYRLQQTRSEIPRYTPKPDSLLYVAASVLPYHTSGYTTRTHEIVSALRKAGIQVYVHTRPGYPWDRKDRLCDAASQETVVGDIHYFHTQVPANNRPVLHYALQAVHAITAAAKRHRVAMIHAASNHVNALPALLAARQLGIPFQYEMRGLWELTRISRQPDYEGSQAYKQGLQLERLVAHHADRLFVISRQLCDYVTKNWGINPHRMHLLPNCVDPERFMLADSEEVKKDTIGYAGSLIGYEGLDTLIEAVSQLIKSGNFIKVNIIGDGESRRQLEEQVQRLNLSEWIHFYGKLAPETAREILGRCALVCIPRKPFKVCEIVPPIKLVEALAMGKPVIVPNLPVFRDELGDTPPGWFFEAGNADDLARVIRDALSDNDQLQTIQTQARKYVLDNRCWQDFVSKLVSPLEERVSTYSDLNQTRLHIS